LPGYEAKYPGLWPHSSILTAWRKFSLTMQAHPFRAGPRISPSGGREMRLMTLKTFEETIDERSAAIELVVTLIAREGREADLHDLRVLLINIMGLVRRDPGIESAADDLYAAAAALVKDSSLGHQPIARKLRLLKDARERFCARLPGAAERSGPKDDLRFQGLEAAYAVQLERSAADGETPPARSAA